MKRTLPFMCMAAMCLIPAGCNDDSKPVTYTEPIPKPPPMMAGQDPHAGHNHGPNDGHDHGAEKQLSWSLPDGWTEAKTGGMILSKISAPEVPGASITLSRLGGTGGGMNPNIQRWAGQLGLPQLTDAELVNVQKALDHSESKAVYIDFNSLPSVKDQSMKVCVFQYADFTLYLKVKGPKNSIGTLSDKFLSLAQSITYK